jgi:hypothetical protein
MLAMLVIAGCAVEIDITAKVDPVEEARTSPTATQPTIPPSDVPTAGPGSAARARHVHGAPRILV